MTARPTPCRRAPAAIAPGTRPGSRRLALVALAAGAAALAPPRGAGAQGGVGVQGFGYPSGQLSTRALGTGGALGEFDPASAINPAATALWGRLGFAFQYEPEFRSTEAGGSSQNLTIPRFPLVAVGLPVRRNLAVGISASSLLDRTFSTSYGITETIAGQQVPAVATYESRGAITDVRVGAGYWLARTLRVGLAGHVLVGENRVNSGRSFPSDSLRYRRIADTVSIDYSGRAFSAGVDWTPVRGIGLAGSYRRGGRLRTLSGDTTLTTASAPDRVGVGVAVDRITGATFAASYSRTTWTRMRGLAGGDVSVSDAPEFAVGADVAGPRLGASPVLLRAGFRRRTLPFGIDGAEARETAFTGGLGAPLAAGRAMLDLAVQRAQRDFDGAAAPLGDARERAWTLSVGVTVRP